MIPIVILAIENDFDREFMASLYIKHYPIMRKSVYNILQKHNDDVDDIIHDACEKLIDKISFLRTFNCYVLTSYIVYTIRSATMDFLKRRNRVSKWFLYETGDEMIDDIPDYAKTPEDLFLDKEKIEKLHIALEQLPEKYRTVLQFKYFFDMSDKDIAVAFDIKPGSVREYLSRARKMVYKILEKDGDLYGIK